jgi:anti-sigma regulatory factor (Ser/Thr protein kinase)
LLNQQERTFPTVADSVPTVRRWVIALAEEASFNKVATDLALAVTEAASNAVRHSGSESLTVLWQAQDNHVVIEVSDEGTYAEHVASPHQLGGLGLTVMTAVMDEVSILRGTGDREGTRVRLVKRKP